MDVARGAAARGRAGAVVRTRNYGFRLPRGRWGCRGAVLTSMESKALCHGHHCALPARSSGAGSAGRGTARQVSDPGLSPSPVFHQNTSVKHSGIMAQPSSCLWGAQPSW